MMPIADRQLARHLAAQRTEVTCVAADEHIALAVGYPKMPG